MQNKPFNNDTEIKATKGLRITNENSSIKEPRKLPDIRNNIQKILSSQDEQKKYAFDLTTNLLSVIKDKTLDENKTPDEREEEKKIISNFANFALIINSDENSEEGMGSVVFANVLARSLLIQRDKINELEYEISSIKKQLNELKSIKK